MSESCEKIVLWGRGVNTERFLFYTGTEDVVAIIDSNPAYHGTVWEGLPVINLEDYLAFYEEYPIIVTPEIYADDIVAVLQEHNIERYILLKEVLDLHMRRGQEAETSQMYGRDERKYRVVDAIQRRFLNAWIRTGSAYFEHQSRSSYTFSLERLRNILRATRHPVGFYPSSIRNDAYSLICGTKVGPITKESMRTADLILYTDMAGGLANEYALLSMEAACREIPLLLLGDGFLLGIEPPEQQDSLPLAYKRPHSAILDEHGIYLDANHPSLIESILASSLVFSKEEKARATGLMKKICDMKLSKYNHQPMKALSIGKTVRKKILIIDQVYGDRSIAYGMADDETFLHMLEAAQQENPGADIYIKTHPVPSKGHFQNVIAGGNIHFLREAINPIILLEAMDKVYVCTSQMGFEALMCGKEVHVYGMPFYAGWGVTIDRQICPRRTRRREIWEIFYVAYVLCTVYVSYRTQGICEIEQAIEEIAELRDRYFAEMHF